MSKKRATSLVVLILSLLFVLQFTIDNSSTQRWVVDISPLQYSSVYRNETIIEEEKALNVVTEDSNKPYLIVHVGPPKTGTTSLQNAFEQLDKKGILAKDNFVYKLYPELPFLEQGCHTQLLKYRQSFNDTDYDEQEMAHYMRHNITCWRDVLAKFQPYLERRTSILISCEPLSFIHKRVWPKDRGHSMGDWRSMLLTLFQDWDFRVIYGYRRYHEWFLSAKQQLLRWTPAKPKMNKWPDSGGAKPKDLRPKIVTSRQNMPLLPYRYADHLMEEMQKNPELTSAVFNMHLPIHKANTSLVSTFVCDEAILPNATNTCGYVREQDHKKSTETVKNPSQSLFYDALAVAGYQKFLKQTKKPPFHRHRVALDAQSFNEETLHQGPLDFPLLCPTKDELEPLLDLSLSLERQIVPEFANMHGVEAEHQASFWQMYEKKKFCWIDVDATLQNETWVNFFQKMSGTVKKRPWKQGKNRQ